METVMSSVRNAVDGDPSRMSQEALLQPVRDMGHSEILRGHFRGTQPFEKGLGFPHRVPELRAWDDVRLKGQVSTSNHPCKFKVVTVSRIIPFTMSGKHFSLNQINELTSKLHLYLNCI